MKFLLHFAYSIVNVHVNHSLWNQDEATEPMFYVSHLNKERRVPRCDLVGEAVGSPPTVTQRGS